MGRIFITGDKHGDFVSNDDYSKVRNFCSENETSTDDVMIVLGDHGIHYDDGWMDHRARKHLSKYPITFVMIRGNHDRRPSDSWTRKLISNDTMTGWFVLDPEYDNILYTEEFGWYTFGNEHVFVIGGAYSVDKWYRLQKREEGDFRYKWFPDEQLNESERGRAERVLFDTDRYITGSFTIMSHTCPQQFKPLEMCLPMIDQETVDDTMEIWMDSLFNRIWEERRWLNNWYCGHWHTDKTGPVRFMYHDIIQFA